MNDDFQLNRHRRNLLLIALVACLMIGASLFMGLGWRTPGELFSPAARGILELRMWRLSLGVLAGASLALAGVVLQTVLRNPLAEPYVLGLSAGAGLGTALCIVLGGLALSAVFLPLSGFAGACSSLLIVYLLARHAHGTTPHTLILAGVVWGSITGSLLMFLVSQSSAEGLHAILWWLLGNLQVQDASLVRIVMGLNGAAAVLLYLFAHPLNALLLGDDGARHVGIAPERTKVVVLGLATLLAAATVSISGIIAFVGLVAPHAARALVGADHRRLLPAAALIGSAFLVCADGIGRMVLYPQEVPVGVLTSLVGGPFFLLLLRRRQKGVWA
jgi:iron complex transport system permease protein